MGGSIALIILIISICGIGFMIYRKLPLLLECSEVAGAKLNWREKWFKKKEVAGGKSFSLDNFLQKVLSKTRVFILKVEHKTASCLEKLREKSKKKNTAAVEDNYWEDIKKSTK